MKELKLKCDCGCDRIVGIIKNDRNKKIDIIISGGIVADNSMGINLSNESKQELIKFLMEN